MILEPEQQTVSTTVSQYCSVGLHVSFGLHTFTRAVESQERCTKTGERCIGIERAVRHNRASPPARVIRSRRTVHTVGDARQP